MFRHLLASLFNQFDPSIEVLAKFLLRLLDKLVQDSPLLLLLGVGVPILLDVKDKLLLLLHNDEDGICLEVGEGWLQIRDIGETFLEPLDYLDHILLIGFLGDDRVERIDLGWFLELAH